MKNLYSHGMANRQLSLFIHGDRLENPHQAVLVYSNEVNFNKATERGFITDILWNNVGRYEARPSFLPAFEV